MSGWDKTFDREDEPDDLREVVDMIDLKQIPDEVVDAHIAIMEKMMIGPPTKAAARKIIAATLLAWPGSCRVSGFWQWGNMHGAHVHLPLPQKEDDA